MAPRSLRRSFLGLWLGWTLVALAVAGFMVTLFERSNATLIVNGKAEATQACQSVGARYRLFAASSGAAGSAEGQARELAAVMQASLYQFPGVEGSLWHKDGGFFGYAYPTYEGTSPKVDLPAAERGNIEGLVNEAADANAVRVGQRRGLREAVITVACPIDARAAVGIYVWTMLRVPLSAGGEIDYLVAAGGLLLLFLVGSGVWAARLGLRWSRAFGGVEGALEQSGADPPRDLAATGLVELDRVVKAINRFGQRLVDARQEASALAARASQIDRLTALGRVAAALAHEIRNPVAAMRLRAENVLAAGPAERQAAALQTILGHIRRIDSLLAEMLAFAQPIALQVRIVELAPWVRERVEGLRERAQKAGVSMAGHAEARSCQFDPEQMARVIDNLLINALQHTPAGGKVELEAAVEKGELSFMVADTGAGIDPSIAPRLFEPFATSRAEGVGLGLSIAREIITAHGGTIALLPSEVGTVFVVKLPCRSS